MIKNDPPTDITVNNKKSADLLENQMGVRVGNLDTTDEDISQFFTYNIISDNFNLFEIQDNYLVLGTYAQVDYEQKKVYHLNISSTDNGTPAKSITKQIQINVIDANDPISKVSLTNYTVVENAQTNSAIARIIIEDEDTTSHHVCTSEAGAFLRNDQQNTVYVARPVNFEIAPFFEYTITCVDGQLTSNWTFKMNVVDVNEAPTVIAITASRVKENQKPPSLIGKLIARDPDNIQQKDRQSLNFTLLNHQDRFHIVNDQLYASTLFNYESEKFMTLQIMVEDSGTPKMSHAELITISITDVNDKPMDILVAINCL